MSSRGLAALVVLLAIACAGADARAQDEGVMAGGLQLRSVRPVHVSTGVEVLVAGKPQRLFDFHLIENRPMRQPMPEARSGDDRLENRIQIESVLHVDRVRALVTAHDRARGAYVWLVPARIDLAQALFWWTEQPAQGVDAWEKDFWRRHRRATRSDLAAMARPAFSRRPAGASAPTFSRSELHAATGASLRYADLAEVIAASEERLANPPPRRPPLAR